VHPICDDGCKTALDEICMVNLSVGALQLPSHRKIDGFQLRLSKAKSLRERRERRRFRVDVRGISGIALAIPGKSTLGLLAGCAHNIGSRWLESTLLGDKVKGNVNCTI
jgi:hypothetical protein